MSLKSELPEIEPILFRLLDNLALMISSKTAQTGADLRRQIGRVRVDYVELLQNGGFGIALLTCFVLAQKAYVKLASLARVRQGLFDENPQGSIAKLIVQTAIIHCLSTESRLITQIEFKSRDDIEMMMQKMRAAFDTARDMAADEMDSLSYQTLTYLAGSLINHLATSARPLPRMIKFTLPKSLPALTLSQRIYYEASRWDEIVQENKIMNPVFCLRDIKGLSR